MFGEEYLWGVIHGNSICGMPLMSICLFQILDLKTGRPYNFQSELKQLISIIH